MNNKKDDIESNAFNNNDKTETAKLMSESFCLFFLIVIGGIVAGFHDAVKINKYGDIVESFNWTSAILIWSIAILYCGICSVGIKILSLMEKN